jgi:hypothetical protein
MATKHGAKKALWRDQRALRKPSHRWQCGKASAWFAETLGLPTCAVALRFPNGSAVGPTISLGTLRRAWADAIL